MPRTLTTSGRRQLAQTEALSIPERKQVFGETAVSLLPRLTAKR